ncbi:hypothetical protein [Cereibacter sphaeroides]|uniref:hypothetical protein n=1 Tax=Cereibacter sphaeroides TaxID=1063 RepID=UPI000191C2AF|nr:hypothetical protein [Cereibacter sphaeroides]ACM01327.1 D12 class N6 adenine-specific DNA methyltransferase [Cereibacter sphaeroides KD131]
MSAKRARAAPIEWLLSINDTPEIRALFGRFHLEPVRLNYLVSASGGTEAQELLVSNRKRIATLL